MSLLKIFEFNSHIIILIVFKRDLIILVLVIEFNEYLKYKMHETTIK